MNSNVKISDRIPRASFTAMMLACAFVVSTAYADDQVRTETVKFQDLNVHTHAGVESLYGRIHAAAKQVCSETDRLQQTRAAACARKAEAHAIEELNLPQLTAYYQLKIGGPTQTRSASR